MLGDECVRPERPADSSAKMVRENPNARIIVTGCYATRRPGEIAALSGLVQIVPNDRKAVFAQEIGLTTAERFGGGDGACGADIAPGLAGRTAFTLRVQLAATKSVPTASSRRHAEGGRSRPMAEVLREIERVRSAGFVEIALTGVHLGSYGRDLQDGSSLLSLLQAIERDASSREIVEPGPFPHQLARADGLRDPLSIWLQDPTALRLISIFRFNMPAIRRSRSCVRIAGGCVAHRGNTRGMYDRRRIATPSRRSLAC